MVRKDFVSEFVQLYAVLEVVVGKDNSRMAYLLERLLGCIFQKLGGCHYYERCDASNVQSDLPFLIRVRVKDLLSRVFEVSLRLLSPHFQNGKCDLSITVCFLRLGLY